MWLLVHVALAFHFYHEWSHEHAFAHTAKQTAALTGLNWGGGLWFNYTFCLLWTWDVVRSWRNEATADRSLGIWMHVIFGFMMFNATAVFGLPFWRWITGVFVSVLLTGAVWRRARGH